MKRSVWNRFPTDVPCELKNQVEAEVLKRIFEAVNEGIDAENANLKKGACCGKISDVYGFNLIAIC